MVDLVPIGRAAADSWHAEMQAEADRLDLLHWGRVLPRGDESALSGSYESFDVRRDDQLIGRLGLRDERDSEHGFPVLHIDSLWVPPELRGRGCGQALVLAADAEARRRRHRLLQLSVRVSNAAALHVYRSLNFVEGASVRHLDLRQPTPYRPLCMVELTGDTDERQLVGRRRRTSVGVLAFSRPLPHTFVARVVRLGARGERWLPALLSGLVDHVSGQGADHLLVGTEPAWDPWLPEQDFPKYLLSMVRQV